MSAEAKCCWCGATLSERPGIVGWWCPTDACARKQLSASYQVKVKGKAQLLYVPTPRQYEFHASPAKYTLFGGAAGPGKSHALRWEFYWRCARYPGYECIILRRTAPELNKTHIRRAAREQEAIGAKLFTGDEKIVKFPNGSLLEFGHCDDDRALSRYLSTEYDAIGLDEWSTFEPELWIELSTRARSSKDGVRGIVKGGSNPGGIGALSLLDFFIDKTPDFDKYPALKKKYRPDQWNFIPALLDDNPYRDEEYEDTLAILSAERYEQLRYGNWRVFAGQFFSAWHETKGDQPWHVVNRTVPKGTEWFASMDWGYTSPGCVIWWACLEDGHFHLAKEWKFAGLQPADVAAGILKINSELRIPRTAFRYVAADPSMWNKGGDQTVIRGESKAETMRRAGIPLRKADNDRNNGWVRCQVLLRDAPDGTPWMTVDPACTYLRRTIPAAVSDKHDPEDVDTRIDDHALDAWRYGAMSRPMPTFVSQPARPKGSVGTMFEELRTEALVA